MDDYCLSYYVVPPPMSPTTKSGGTPSDAGSQDSDGAVGPRYIHTVTHMLLNNSVSNNVFPCLKCSTLQVWKRCQHACLGGIKGHFSTQGRMFNYIICLYMYSQKVFFVLSTIMAMLTPARMGFQCPCHSFSSHLSCRCVVEQIN